MTTHEKLLEAKVDFDFLSSVLLVLADEDCWCQHSRAKSYTGRFCNPSDSDAESFCLQGAAQRVGARWHTGIGIKYADDRLAELLGFNGIYDMQAWNDTPGRTHAQVIERIEGAMYVRKAA